MERFRWKRFERIQSGTFERSEKRKVRTPEQKRWWRRTAKFSYNFNFLIWNLANFLVSQTFERSRECQRSLRLIERFSLKSCAGFKWPIKHRSTHLTMRRRFEVQFEMFERVNSKATWSSEFEWFYKTNLSCKRYNRLIWAITQYFESGLENLNRSLLSFK